MGAVKRNTLSVLFIIKKAKLLKNGEAPICMRITVNKRVAEVMIKRSIPVDLWNQKKECSKGKDRIATELNHYINTVRAKVLQIHRELEIDNKPITADTIKDCFYGRDKVQRSLLEVYAEHNEKCHALIGKEYTESTVTKFDTSINRLKEYKCIKKGVLLPVISNQRMNAYLKEIADLCGITKRLTTHVARHTAATVVFLANDVSMENVSKILGHSNIRMTQHYAKVLDSSIMRDMANVERNFLKG